MRKLVALGALVVSLGACSSGPQATTPVAPAPQVLVFENPTFADNRVVRIQGVKHGAIVARLTVPALDLHSYPIRFGTSMDILAQGPGLYPGSAAPGEGNFAMAGHRITPVGPWRTCSTGEWGTPDCHGPFRYVNKLRKGDTASVVFKGQVYSFELMGTTIVKPTDIHILRDGLADMTFTACHPPGYSTYRIVAQWRLANAQTTHAASEGSYRPEVQGIDKQASG